MSAFILEAAYAELNARNLAQIPVEVLDAMEPISRGYPISGDMFAAMKADGTL